MYAHALILAALANFVVAAPQLSLAPCAPGASSQTFSYDAANQSYVLVANANCIDILAWSTARGAEAYTAPCHHEDRDPAHQNQNFSAPATSAPGALIVELMSGLALDVDGAAVAGAAIALGAGARFFQSAAGGLVHAASGLCVDAGAVDPFNGAPAANLRACDDARAAFQLLSSAGGALALVTPDLMAGVPLCLARAAAVAGQPLGAVACAASAPAQAFNYDAACGSIVTGDGALSVDAAAAAAAAYQGLPVVLAPPAPARAWARNGTAAAARFVHPSGLCLDLGRPPWGHACLDPAQRALPYCDGAQPLAARVADLLGRLTLKEKVALTGSGMWSNGAGSCDTIDPGVPRLAIPPKQWLVETNSMAASQCYGARCATVFPSALNLAASGNATLWAEKGRVVSDEMRALNNLAWHRADGGTSYSGLNGFGPDINQPRDPRNGRVGELAGEDPLLTGLYAVEYIRGMQEGADPRFLKMTAGVKHYAGYSMETNRFTSTGNFTRFDFADSYALPFYMSFVLGNASGSMCSYISLSFDGGPMVPACANDFILNQLVRESWQRPGAVHTSDCGAVAYMKNKRFTANDTFSAAAALNGGLDLNSNTILPAQLELAIALGLKNETVLDRSVSRTLAWRFRLGQLDPLEAQPAYMALGAEDIGAPASVAAAAEGSAQGLVLVKRGALPLAAGARVAVVGPLGVADEALLGDYYADSVCPGANGYSNSVGYGCVETIAAAVARHNAGGATTAFAGVSVHGNDTSWAAALAAAAAADAVVLVVGTDRTVAGEGTDLRDTGLPGAQGAFALAVAAAAAGKPLVLVLVSSFPIALDGIIDAFPAVVLAYTPGMRGGDAVAAALFGANRWGRAVLTHYPRNYTESVALDDFGMVPSAVNPGRTYRYYDGSSGAPSVVFGQGLSYNTLALACTGGAANDTISLACNVLSTAGPDGDQVLHVFHRVGADVAACVAGAHAIPLRSLVAVQRLALPAGTTRAAGFSLVAADALFLTNAAGGRTIYAGTHFFDVCDGENNATVAITVNATTAGAGLLGGASAAGDE